MKIFLLIFILLTIAGPIWVATKGGIDYAAHWQTANRESLGIAPKPEQFKEAIILVYAARAFNWRGIFGLHLWIATKAKNANAYKVYQATGWRVFRGLPSVSILYDLPDRVWFNAHPTVVYELKGVEAAKWIPAIEAAAKNYPDTDKYRLWPGPNSNTFIAYIARQIPQLGINLPSNALGKDYLAGWKFFARAPSGTGYQFSLFGLFGILIAKKEGLEINFMGLVYGIDPLKLGIKLPAIGEISLV